MLMRKIIIGMVLLVCAAVVAPASAMEYYVATDGNDSSDGNEAQPWRTVQKAADVMQAGDTVYIKAGTYAETVTPANSGTEVNYITYQAYGDGEVTIKGGGLRCIYLPEANSLEYLHFKNLTLEGGGMGTTAACFDANGGEVKSHIILEGLTLTKACNGVRLERGVTDSSIIDCNMHHNGNGIEIWGYPNFECSDITIANNHIYQNSIQGILVWLSKNVLIRGNHCHHNGATGIQIESYGSESPVTRNVVVEDNLCESNSQGYTGETGIWIDDSDDVLVQNNIMRYNETGLKITGSFNVIARNNIVYENKREITDYAAGVAVYETSQRGACGDNIVVHNTFYRNGEGPYGGDRAQIVIGLWDDKSADNAVFKNNITSSSLSSHYCTYLDLWVYGLSNELNYNNYYQPVESLNVSWQPDTNDDANVISWSQYLLSSGQDSNSITSDPCFIDPNTLIDPNDADFHLRPGSGCIDAGAFLTATETNGSDTSLVVVADSRYFCDGYGLIDGDLIKVGSNPPVRVLDVNYDTNTLSVDQNLSWNAGGGVSYAYLGSSPDMGAYEYGPLVYNKTQDTSYESIQPAIDDANNGDEIVVYPGTYYGTIAYNGKAITLCGASPNDWDVVAMTIIDANDANSGVVFDLGEGNSSVLRGLTITGAVNGIDCNSSSPTISKCVIRDNASAGVYCAGGAPVILNNKIYSNGSYGINLSQTGSSTVVKNNWVYDDANGIYLDNPQGAAEISNNTIVNNTSKGICKNSGTAPTITNCIVWNYDDDLYDCNATYSCIEDGDAGTGNISADPCFVNDINNDFHIDIHSPCVDAGDLNGDYTGQTDIDCGKRFVGPCIDMGADESNFPGAAHYWMLDETSGTSACDSLGDSNGSFNGSDPCWAGGLIGGAIDCNGGSDYFSVSSLDTDYNSSDTFTVAGWFKTSQSTGIQTIVGQWGHYKPVPYVDLYFGWQVLVENKKVVARFGAGNTTTSDITGTSDVDNYKWHHFALVYPTSSSNAILYVDGNSQGTPGTKTFPPAYTKFRIGDGGYVYAPYGGTAVLKGGPFSGKIDDVMIFSRALSAGEIEQLYEQGKDLMVSSQAANYWMLDETSGTVAYDSVGDSDGAFNGSDPCWVVGKFGGAIDCNGGSDYFSVSGLDTAYNFNSTFSVAGWFNTSQSTGIQTIVGQWGHYKPNPYAGDLYFGWQVLVESNDVVARFGTADTTSDITGTRDVNDGSWHHFALVYPTNSSNAVLYVDGDSQGTPGQKTFYTSYTKFRIGDGSYVYAPYGGTAVLKGGPFNGLIDDVMVFNYALSADEVEQLFEDGQ